MKRLILCLLIAIAFLLVSCTSDDPITDDLYMRGTLYTWNGTDYVAVNTNLGSGNGTTDHSLLTNLDFASSGHIGFESETHVTEHENGGNDEIDVTGLSGLLADSQNPLAHASTHEWEGTDEINIISLMGGIRQLNFLTLDSDWTETTTGSGNVVKYIAKATIQTGTTVNSTAGYVGGHSDVFQTYTDYLCEGFCTKAMIRNTPDMRENWIGYFEDQTTFPTTTSEHFGFRLFSDANGDKCDLYSSTGNGTAGTQTLLESNLSAWTIVYMLAFFTSDTEVDFYYSVDDGATWNTETHTTNILDDNAYFFGYWATNYEASKKELAIMGQPRILLSSEYEG